MSIFKTQWKLQNSNEFEKIVKEIIKHAFYYIKPLKGFT